jgi:hypothetical protein
MKDYLKLMQYAIAVIVSIAFLGFVANSLGFVSFKFFAPKVEQVRYDTMKQSQAYNDGMLRDLQNLKLEYLRGNPEQQAALRAIVIQRFSVYDTTRLPPDLQSFYLTVQGIK